MFFQFAPKVRVNARGELGPFVNLGDACSGWVFFSWFFFFDREGNPDPFRDSKAVFFFFGCRFDDDSLCSWPGRGKVMEMICFSVC